MPSLTFTRPSRRLYFRMLGHSAESCSEARWLRNSRKGSSHSSPFSTIASIEASLLTTVQVQQPNLELPHEGVVLSITSGHSPACALRYRVTRSRLFAPQGDGT